MASVEGFAPLQRPLGFGGMDGEPALHRQFFISSLYAAMGGTRGNLQKCMGFMSFSQHTRPLYEQSRRSGLLIIGMGTLMEGAYLSSQLLLGREHGHETYATRMGVAATEPVRYMESAFSRCPGNAWKLTKSANMK